MVYSIDKNDHLTQMSHNEDAKKGTGVEEGENTNESEQFSQFQRRLVDNGIVTNAAIREIISQQKAKEKIKSEERNSAEPDSTNFLKLVIAKMRLVLHRNDRVNGEFDHSINSCLCRRTSSKQLLMLKGVSSLKWENMSEKWRKPSSLLCETKPDQLAGSRDQDHAEIEEVEQSKTPAFVEVSNGMTTANEACSDAKLSKVAGKAKTVFIVDFGFEVTKDEEEGGNDLEDEKKSFDHRNQTKLNGKKNVLMFCNEKGGNKKCENQREPLVRGIARVRGNRNFANDRQV